MAIAVGAAGALAALQPTPSGSRLDPVYAAVLGAAAAAAGRHARRLPASATLAGAAVLTSGPAQLVALCDLALVAVLRRQRRRPMVGSIGTSVAAWSLVAGGPHGAITGPVVGVLVLAPVAVSAARRTGLLRARWFRRAIMATAAVAALAAVGSALLALSLSHHVDRAIAAIRSAEAAGAAGRWPEADAMLSTADREVRAAEAAATNPAARLVQALPVLGPNIRAMRAMTAVSVSLVDSGRVAFDAFSHSAERTATPAGRLDLLDQMQAASNRLLGAVTGAQDDTEAAQSPWLLGPVADRLSTLTDRLDRATQASRSLEQGTALASRLLKGPSRVAVLFGNPSESRAFGGFNGAVAILRIEGGAVHLVLSKRSAVLTPLLNPGHPFPDALDPSLPTSYAEFRPTVYAQGLTGTPDFQTIAASARSLLEPLDGPIDAVVYLDPAALAAALRAVGPVQVEGFGTVNADNVEQLLLVDQYVRYGSIDERNDALGAIADSFTHRVSDQSFDPVGLARALAAEAGTGHLAANVPGNGGLLDTLGVSGDFPPSHDANVISVRQSATAANKLDAYVTRTSDLTATVHSDGMIDATLVVTLRNDAPAGLPWVVEGDGRLVPAGTVQDEVAVFTDLDSNVLPQGDGVISSRRTSELGVHRIAAVLQVPRGEARSVTFQLRGAAKGSGIDLVPQPIPKPELMHAIVLDDSSRVLASHGMPGRGDPTLSTTVRLAR